MGSLGGIVHGSLTHPTQNSHAVQNPYAPFHGTNGVSHDFGLSVPGIGGGFGSVYDRGNNYNNGVNSTNQPITKQFAQRTDTIFGPDQCGYEQPVFISGTSSNLSYEASNYVVSVYALNFYLSSPAGRERFKNDDDFNVFNKTWRFAGVMKSKESQESIVNSNTRVITVTTAKRAQIADITRVQERGKYNRYTVNDNDALWFVPRRYEDDDKNLPRYTQVDVYHTPSRMAPSPAICEGYFANGEAWTSHPIRVGFVNIVHGDRSKSIQRTAAARRVMRGNNGSAKQRWLDLQTCGRIDIMLAIGH
jgi:hypothetical protein